MKTLEEIQNDFAIKNGYKNITELMEESVKKGNTLQILLDLDKICIKVQQEQQKLISENARIRIVILGQEDTAVSTTSTYIISSGADIKVDRISIINENNIIK